MFEVAAFLIIVLLMLDVRRRLMRLKEPDVSTESGIVVDTSALIDGRFLRAIELQFLSGLVIVPEAVLSELKKLADLKGPYDRSRALAGMENMKKLYSLNTIKVNIDKHSITDEIGVDDVVMAIAMKRHARLCTNDYALQKRAEAQQCTVLNINELAHAMRVRLKGGDVFKLTIASKGALRRQGVGYTDDGIMVVIEQAGQLVGKSVEVEVRKTIETPSGQTAFARLVKRT